MSREEREGGEGGEGEREEREGGEGGEGGRRGRGRGRGEGERGGGYIPDVVDLSIHVCIECLLAHPQLFRCLLQQLHHRIGLKFSSQLLCDILLIVITTLLYFSCFGVAAFWI